MQILEQSNAVLTNVEVLAFLKKKEKQYADQERTETTPANLRTVMRDVKSQLERRGSPMEPGPSSAKYFLEPSQARQRSQMIKQLTDRLADKPWCLALTEIVTIFNLRPKDVAALDPIIEENESRFTPEQMEELMGIVREVLGGPAEEEADGEDGEE